MRQMSPGPAYGRTLRASPLCPSQIGPPGFTAAASATSSISAPRSAATPPMRASADRRSSTVPPAAAATGLAMSFTCAKG